MNEKVNDNQGLAIIRNSKIVTEINLVRVESANQQALLQAMKQAARELTAKQKGFIGLGLHHSLDGSRLVMYSQWQSLETYQAAQSNPAYAEFFAHYGELVIEDKPRTYDVIYSHDRDGITTIAQGKELATFVNVISTTPAQQQQLLDFVIENDKGAFSTHPGYRSANFHRSYDGERIVNYSHWDKEASFLEAIRNLVGVPDVDMEQANRIATAGAKGLGQTDFRFYEVDFVALAD